ncbi:hypothetical protein [Nocardioides sp. KR10-350]|uniref:hypothetical protein n=1 Tax=Nocardioides cheoyonin TaxID=3156615 RepID=UPI0032B36EF8
MKAETAIKDRSVLPETVVTEPSNRILTVLTLLMARPVIAYAAHELYQRHGLPAIAYLAAVARPKDLIPADEEHQKAFSHSYFGSYDSWEQARTATIKEAVALAKLAADGKSAEGGDPDRLAREFFDTVTTSRRFVRIDKTIHVFDLRCPHDKQS